MKITFLIPLFLCGSLLAVGATVDDVAMRLDKAPTPWERGKSPKIELPKGSAPELVAIVCLRKSSLKGARITEAHIEEVKAVKIRSTDYIGVRVRTNLGQKVVLLRYFMPQVGWWAQVFDVEMKRPNKSPEPTPTAVTPRATEPKSK